MSSENIEKTDDLEQGISDNEEQSFNDLDALNDEEFEEYLNSGKLPDRLNNQLEENVEESVEEEEKEESETPITNESDSDDKLVEEPNKNDKETESTNEINYKEIYDSIFKPFKANGKEITPRNVEDVISLMQMGANYTKKMQVYAPMRKTIESLNQAGINEEQLNFLIDIHKGDKEAIKKLLKNSDIDPLDLDLEQVNYKPNQNIVSDEEVEFATVLSDIQESVPKIQEITNKMWDKESTNALLKDPKLLIALHEEIQLGRFDKVQKVLELERTFGRYRGVPDLQAYIDIVNKMPNENTNTVVNTKDTTEIKKDTTINKTKAAPVRSTKGKIKTTITHKDLLDMSDEEFKKLSIQEII